VFTQEVLELLAPKDGDCILDATAGEGGHSFAMLSVAPEAQLVALDADPAAVATTRKRLEQFGERATVVESNFENINKVLKKQGVVSIDKALFDLGWNSGQLASGRGFSFLHDEPLNMSYGKKPASGFTAQEALNQWDEETLANVIYGYGEERYARRIAKAIVERREVEPIKSTIELVEIIKDAVPAAYRHGRLHFATRTFQALRIAVNDELGVIERGLKAAWEHLSSGLPGKGGRIAVISFHSVEDRVVKRAFAAYAKESGRLVIKKPLTPSRAEIIHNPRARSAKLRVIEKICKEQ
jgi:16S rRNA (cytosine1402-N4)-methyltransferase